jgi:hypothetical protein
VAELTEYALTVIAVDQLAKKLSGLLLRRIKRLPTKRFSPENDTP